MSFSHVLKELRIERGLSQKKLGEMLFTIDSTITNWEKGRAEPNISTLLRLAGIFEVSLDYLCGRTENPQISELYALAAPLKKDEKEIVYCYSKLTKINKIRLISYLRGMLEGQSPAISNEHEV